MEQYAIAVVVINTPLLAGVDVLNALSSFKGVVFSVCIETLHHRRVDFTLEFPFSVNEFHMQLPDSTKKLRELRRSNIMK